MKWPEYALSQLSSSFISGGTPSTKVREYWEGEIPWITGADIVDGEVSIGRRYINESAVSNSATNIVPERSLLIVTRTGVGKIAIAPVDIAISQDLTGIVLKKGIDPKFALAAIRSRMGVLLAAQRGATIKGVTRDAVKRLIIPLPPLYEQRRIVEILDQSDALRKKRAEADAKAARILPALFYKMFGDPAMNPKGWEQKPFGDTFDDCTAQFPKLQRNAYLQNGHFPVVDQGEELIAGYTDDESLVTAMDQPVIVFGDHTRIVKFVDFPFVAGADGSRVFMAKKGFTPAFLACQLELQHIPNLGYSRHMRELRRLQFIAPPFELQRSFANCAMDIRPLLKFKATCCSRIDVLFHCLLHRAFTGDLTAKWREAHIKELLAEMEAQAKALEALEAPPADDSTPEARPKRGRRQKAVK